MLVFPCAGGLDLPQTLQSGQCFRWQSTPQGWLGVVERRAVLARTLPGGALELTGLAGYAPEAEPAFWQSYFALDMDYAALQRVFCAAHPRLAGCVACAPGIRVLRQPFFETLVSFIISQNNNIPRIRAIIGRLCRALGEPLGPVPPELAAAVAVPAGGTADAPAGQTGAGTPGGLYAFPTAQRLATLGEEDLAFLRAGWRAAYILDAARCVAGGTLREQELRALPTEQARRLLMQVRGVGPKVADCTLLYGLARWDAYPVDVWMKKADRALFTGRVRDAGRYLNRRTGGTAGIAQQYIFAWAQHGPGRELL